MKNTGIPSAEDTDTYYIPLFSLERPLGKTEQMKEEISDGKGNEGYADCGSASGK